MDKINYDKLYTTYEPDPEDLRRRGHEFGHPEIRLGYAYDPQRPYWTERAQVTFQVNINPDPSTHIIADAYAAEVHCALDRLKDISAVISKAMTKAYELAPDERDAFKTLIVGLRAIGYRRATLKNGTTEIVSAW